MNHGFPFSPASSSPPAADAALVVAHLIVIGEGGGDRVVAIAKSVTTIGRAGDSDVAISDRQVSNRHAEVHRVGSRYVLHDARSRNGTFVNGARVSEAVLRFEDEITLGGTAIVFSDKRVTDKTTKVSAEAIEVARELSLLYRLASSAQPGVGAKDLFERVLDLALEAVRGDRAAIALPAEVHGAGPEDLVPRAVRARPGPAPGPVPAPAPGSGPGSGADARLPAKLPAPISFAEGTIADEALRGGKAVVRGSAIAVPLRVGDDILGVVQVERTGARRGPFEEADMRLLALVCNQAAASLASARVFEEARRIAKQNEDVLRQCRQKDELLSMVAHDLRTPLTSIAGFAEVVLRHLETGAGPDRVRDHLKLFGRIADEMTELLSDLLDVARVESGKIPVARERRPIAPLLEECYERCVLLAEPRKLGVQLDLETDLPLLSIDVRRIGQVLRNLIHNAFKFSKPGGIVTIGARRGAGAGPGVEIRAEEGGVEAVLISVADTGPGIAPEDLPRVFEPFEQGSARPASGELGTGLGLAIAKKLVELHGGRIWVESRQGVGTRFSFSIPVD